MERIILARHAFETMVASAIEVYKRETLGYLFGRQRGAELRISHAVPLQTSTRRFNQVQFPPERRDRRIASLGDMLGRDLLGDFHSHTDFDGVVQKRLSSHDRASLRTSPYPVALVLSVETGLSRTSPWAAWRSDPVIYGAIRSNEEVFGVMIRAYVEIEGRLRRARVSVPRLLPFPRGRCGS